LPYPSSKPLRIVIVEDEPPIAEDIERTVRDILGDRVETVEIFWTLDKAMRRLDGGRIDLCLLDLNLSGRNGFALLQQAVSRPFPTVIVSAHTDQALRAFEFGVLDFVPKPLTRERLEKALDRCFGRRPPESRAAVRTLVVRQGRENVLIPVADVRYFKGARYLVEAHLDGGRQFLLDKSLDTLERILAPRFLRAHRAYLVAASRIASFAHRGGGTYRLRLKDGGELPLSRAGRDRLRRLLQAGERTG
jgi:two-component system response regulator LytT